MLSSAVNRRKYKVIRDLLGGSLVLDLVILNHVVRFWVISMLTHFNLWLHAIP
jgi:hypothetical protein